jgi:hypothetical protein
MMAGPVFYTKNDQNSNFRGLSRKSQKVSASSNSIFSTIWLGEKIPRVLMGVDVNETY